MRNRRCLQPEKPDSAQRTALTGQILAAPDPSLLEHKSLMAAYNGLTDPEQTERTTAHLPTVFDNLYYKLERLYDQTSVPSVRDRAVAISWAEIVELPLEIIVNICASRAPSSAKESSATEHASSPTAAAFSHARACIAETNRATESIWWNRVLDVTATRNTASFINNSGGAARIFYPIRVVPRGRYGDECS